MRSRVVLVGAVGGAVISTVALAAEPAGVAPRAIGIDRLVYGAAAWGRWGLQRFKPGRLAKLTKFARWSLSLRHKKIDVCRYVYCYQPAPKDQVAAAKPPPPKMGISPRVTHYGAP